MATLERVLSELQTISALLRELLTTSRFNRGGYDGPYLAGESFSVSGTRDTQIFTGRGDPTALVIQWTGTGVPDEKLYVGADKGMVMSGFSAVITNNGELRVIADEGDFMYAKTDGGTVTLRVTQGRL